VEQQSASYSFGSHSAEFIAQVPNVYIILQPMIHYIGVRSSTTLKSVLNTKTMALELF
jgi:hypothetical protein